MHAKHIVLYALIALFVMSIFLISGGCKKCELEKLSEYEGIFGVISDLDPSPPKKFNVFIDASASMYGYTDKESKFDQIIKSVISRIPLDTEIKLYGFGQTGTELKGDLRQMLHVISDRNFYTQKETDLCIPFERHITQDPNAVNLIFTDMVQSTEHSGKDRVIFARMLKAYLGDNGFLSLMATQADFEGYYNTEKKPGKLQVPAGSTRPLFCLAFGNRKYSQFIEDKIGTLFSNTFEFGNTKPNKLQCTDNIDSVNDPTNLLLEGNTEGMPVSSFKLKKGYTEALKFTLSGYEESFGKTVDYSFAYKSKADSTYHILDKHIGYTNAETFENDNKVSFKVPFTNKNPGCYICRLTFRKTLPQWIMNLSTDDDTSLENISKTYKLESWMNFIMNNFEDYKHLATTQYFIVLDRR